MGLVSDQRKFMKARLTLSSLKCDMGNITTPCLRKYVLSQIAGMETHASRLAGKINMYNALDAQKTQDFYEKKSKPSKAIKIVKVKKGFDK